MQTWFRQAVSLIFVICFLLPAAKGGGQIPIMFMPYPDACPNTSGISVNTLGTVNSNAGGADTLSTSVSGGGVPKNVMVVVLAVMACSGACPNPNVSDTAGNIYTGVTQTAAGLGFISMIYWSYLTTPLSGSDKINVQVTGSGGLSKSMFVSWLSGAVHDSPNAFSSGSVTNSTTLTMNVLQGTTSICPTPNISFFAQGSSSAGALSVVSPAGGSINTTNNNTNFTSYWGQSNLTLSPLSLLNWTTTRGTPANSVGVAVSFY